MTKKIRVEKKFDAISNALIEARYYYDNDKLFLIESLENGSLKRINHDEKGRVVEIISRGKIQKFRYEDSYTETLEEKKQSSTDKIYLEIEAELERAKKLHPNFPNRIVYQLAIMQEEAGEATKAVLDFLEGKVKLSEVKKELIQTCAMCVRMLEQLNKIKE